MQYPRVEITMLEGRWSWVAWIDKDIRSLGNAPTFIGAAIRAEEALVDAYEWRAKAIRAESISALEGQAEDV